ncbi:hypothetical protein JAAARDRAFT_158434, partial [Jaapia argillacea MUCL 33604]
MSADLSPAQHRGSNYWEALRENLPLSIHGVDLPSEVSRVERDVSALDAQIEKLTRKRDDSLINLRDMKSLLSPVRRVPPDVLSSIFIECVGQDKYVDPWRNPVSLLLARICHHWRRVALSTPLLWSSILVHACEVPAYHSIPYIALINLFLERSGAVPLSLVFNLQDLEMEGLVDVLIPHIHRCKDLILTFDDSDAESSPACRVLRSIEAKAPLLQVLSLCGPADRTLPHIDIGREAPLLRRVTVEVPPMRLRLPWSRLTHLH